MTDKNTADDWLALLAIGQPNDADLEAFRCWREDSAHNARAFDEAAWIWRASGGALDGAFEQASPSRGRHITRRIALSALAASAAGALLWRPPLDLWPSMRAFAADVRTGAGEQRTVALGSGGSASLNTRTSLDIIETSLERIRVTLIEGEALFDAGGEAIEVQLKEFSAQARAARFNVYRVGGEARVHCLSGDVLVAGASAERKLAPGQRIIRRGTMLAEVQTAPPQALSWTEGRLIFRNLPLEEAIAEINRYRAGRIFITRDTLNAERVTADFTIADIESVLPFLERAYGATLTRLPGGIVLVG